MDSVSVQDLSRCLAVIVALQDALESSLSALDLLMGNTDLDGDDSPEFRAMQKGRAALALMTGGKDA